jgi:adenylylsulfate kinase-like enzyme
VHSGENFRRFVISAFLRYSVEYILARCPIFWDHLIILAAQLAERYKHQVQRRCFMIIWLIGLSGAGKTTIASEMYTRLQCDTDNLVLLDGDVLRDVWGDKPGHDISGRMLNAHRISHLCKMLDEQGIHVIASVLSNFPEWQAWNREHFSTYFEIYLDVPLDVVEARDTKGIYAAHRAGREPNVVGLDIPFTPPANPDMVLDSSGAHDSAVVLAARIIEAMPDLETLL